MQKWQVDMSWTSSPSEPEDPADDAGSNENLVLLRQAALQLQQGGQEAPEVEQDRDRSPSSELDVGLRAPFRPPQEGEQVLRVVWAPEGASRWRDATDLPPLDPFPVQAPALGQAAQHDEDGLAGQEDGLRAAGLVPPVGPEVVTRPVVEQEAPGPAQPVPVGPVSATSAGPRFVPVWLRPVVPGPQAPPGMPQWPQVAQLFPASVLLTTLAA